MKIIQQGAEAIISLDKNQITKNRIKKSYRIKEIDEKLRKSRTRSEAKIINKLNSIIPVPRILKTDDKQEIIMEYVEGKKLSDNLEFLDYKKISKTIGEILTKLHNQNIIHGDLTTSNMIYVENSLNSGFDKSPIKNRLIVNNDNKITAKSTSMRVDGAEKFNAAEQSEAIENNQNTDASLNESLSQHLDLNININLVNNKLAKQSSKSKIANSSAKLYLIDFGLSFHSNRIEDKAVDLHLLQQALEAKHFTIWQECFKIIIDNYNPEKYKEIIQRIKVIESRGRYKERY